MCLSTVLGKGMSETCPTLIRHCNVYGWLRTTCNWGLAIVLPRKQTYKQCCYISVGKKSKLDATECFIALIICSTCFGHLYAHHQELETILVLLSCMVCDADYTSVIVAYGVWRLGCWWSAVRSRAVGLCVRDEGNCAHNFPHPGWVSEWVCEQVSKWTIEWVSGWVSERVSEWVGGSY